MRTTTARLALAASGLAVLGVVGGAHAALPVPGPKTLTVVDPSGDGKVAGDDITKVTYSTTGTRSKVGKKLVYKPKALTMAIETATPIVTDGSMLYEVEGNVPGCGSFYLNVSPGAALELLFGSCSDDSTVDFSGSSFAVSGKTLTFTVPFGEADGFKAGSTVTDVLAYTGTVDPVTGIVGPSTVNGHDPFAGTPGEGHVDVSNDLAKTSSPYKIG